ncbi:helix-turn-helix domain-containing protein [Clostridium sp. YIM B02551]|uniref:helix-turn-helix domain-containing protein n=1 Tax=Clostridium sp. YIM B02551 TaxID=2910679 RepID=UPI001EEB1E8D|nr:helix-turn-helix transcriptional regulator [Clostridium sp. YIM B02551]
MQIDKKFIGMKIKEARKYKAQKYNKKYTGDNLATDLNISRGYLGDIESGRTYPNYKILINIIKICEVDLSFFVDFREILNQIIEKNFSNLSKEMINELSEYIYNSLSSSESYENDIYELDLNDWLNLYLKHLSTDDSLKINEPFEKYTTEKITEFKTPQQAIKFILEQPALMNYGGYDITKMSDEDIIDFANELLRQLEILSYKYKK